MKAAIKMNEAEELMLRGAALTEQAMEQVSGGNKAVNSAYYEEIFRALVDIGRSFRINKSNVNTFEEFWEKITPLIVQGIIIGALEYKYKREIAKEYNSWSYEERKIVWRAVWTVM